VRIEQAVNQRHGVGASVGPGEPGEETPPSVSVSIGSAIFPRDGDQAERLIAAAERRLQQARQQGSSLIMEQWENADNEAA
jgi:GGDEF domain-containing protein